MRKQVIVSVPASSGNIGPGFDVLGMALRFRNKLRIRVLDKKPGAPLVHIRGEGADSLPRDARNIIYKAAKVVFSVARKRVPKLEFSCDNRIPLARGLGSSAAAVLSSLLGTNALLGNPFSKEKILEIATQFEGHPDNVAPALYGGIQASVLLGEKVITVPWPIPKVGVVVAVPDFHLSTKKARKILPKRIPLKDAVFNISAVAMMPHAFRSDQALMKDLLMDRLHEPYRARLIPGFHEVKRAALKAGALGVTLSGAGPTVLSFVRPRKAARVARAMVRAFGRRKIRCRVMKHPIDRKGAVIQ